VKTSSLTSVSILKNLKTHTLTKLKEWQLWDVEFQTVQIAVRKKNSLQFYRCTIIPVFKAK